MIWTIAKREIITRGRTKPFQILTAFMFLGVILVAVLVSLLTGGDDEAEAVTIGLTGAGEEFAPAFSVPNDQFDPTIVVTDEGDVLLGNDEIDVLFDGETLTWKSFADPGVDLYVRSSVQQAEFARRAADLGLPPGDLVELFSEVPIDEALLDGDEDEQGVRIATAAASTIGMFIILQVWGAFLMMGVIEEKSSRVVEVLLSHISARTLLTGKILGLGILALIQMLLLVAGMIAGLALVQGIEVPDGVWGAVPLLLVMFIFGFAFYAALFAAVGSTVSRQEDAQTAQLPAMLPMLLGYGIAMSSIGAPDTLVVRVASFVPFTSPIVMPFRMAMTNPPWWEIALSLAILAISVPIILDLAGKIYRTSLLKVGTRIPLIEAFRNRSQA